MTVQTASALPCQTHTPVAAGKGYVSEATSDTTPKKKFASVPACATCFAIVKDGNMEKHYCICHPND